MMRLKKVRRMQDTTQQRFIVVGSNMEYSRLKYMNFGRDRRGYRIDYDQQTVDRDIYGKSGGWDMED